ncbi:hypothetical protein [Paenibacillus sp. PDC88]|uniref:hypothetical protein n=1 Tax=Paenibacillus TaxID=44249 RepID=UPI000896B588|nr:hypothetical protein [Paenibacillus sp. PDC88]SDX82804.1 hypothetical protein SAMN05518848_11824 [Paenibacillus sp. PDC88]
MTAKHRELTSFGVLVKKRLLEKRMSQKQFCNLHNIPEIRFCEILYGVISGKRRYRKIIIEKLGIPEHDALQAE